MSNSIREAVRKGIAESMEEAVQTALSTDVIKQQLANAVISLVEQEIEAVIEQGDKPPFEETELKIVEPAPAATESVEEVKDEDFLEALKI